MLDSSSLYYHISSSSGSALQFSVVGMKLNHGRGGYGFILTIRFMDKVYPYH